MRFFTLYLILLSFGIQGQNSTETGFYGTSQMSWGKDNVKSNLCYGFGFYQKLPITDKAHYELSFGFLQKRESEIKYNSFQGTAMKFFSFQERDSNTKMYFGIGGYSTFIPIGKTFSDAGMIAKYGFEFKNIAVYGIGSMGLLSPNFRTLGICLQRKIK
jgi:hypothetical protein